MIGKDGILKDFYQDNQLLMAKKINNYLRCEHIDINKMILICFFKLQ